MEARVAGDHSYTNLHAERDGIFINPGNSTKQKLFSATGKCNRYVKNKKTHIFNINSLELRSSAALERINLNKQARPPLLTYAN